MRSKFGKYKQVVIKLRKKGKTYGEIIKAIGQNISKSTLSLWCNKIYLTSEQKKTIDKKIKNNCEKGRAVAWAVNKERRDKYLKSIFERNKYLAKMLKDKDIAKITLATLYLGEGSKCCQGSLMFGNSDPNIIALFLKLLRFCYNVNETKFRVTLQCRADQNIKFLEKFWANTTKISLNQFYKARIDPRTIGKISKKPNYKGVCRIDYFNAETFTDLMEIGKILYNG